MTVRSPHSLALVFASIVPALTVVWSVDPLTPVVVGAVIVAMLAPRVSTRFPVRRIGAVLLVASTFSVTSLLYARPEGTVYVEWGVVTISDGSFDVALASFLRILAIAIPAVLVFASVEPHELIATTVVKRVVPQRAALAALIALRLAPVIVADLSETRVARRAGGKSTRFSSLMVTTLVIAIRRAIRMAEIAEVRGFSKPDRVWTSYRPYTSSDWFIVWAAVASAGFALAVTFIAGVWNSAI